MNQVFLVTYQSAAMPLTVVARDVADAFNVFHLWRETHAVHALNDNAQLQKLTAHCLADEPQLRDVVESGSRGVAYWLGHREGWTIASPEGERLGELTAPQSAVKCWEFPDLNDLGTVLVFEETRERAIATLHLYSLDRCGWDANYWSFSELSPWRLNDEKLTLREEMFDGRTGVGMLCDDGLWRIYPADYDATRGARVPRAE